MAMALRRVVRSNQTFQIAFFSASSYSSKYGVIDHDTNKPKLLHKLPSTLTLIRNDYKLNPEDVIYGCKLMLSRKFSDPLVQKEMDKVTYKIRQGADKICKGPPDEAIIETSYGMPISGTFVLFSYLEMARGEAYSYLGKSVSRAVITYPAFYSAYQLKQMLKVGRGTGLELIHTIDEATAAALAYGMNNKEEGHLFVVIDLGGRTFDVSVLQVSAGGRFKFKVPTKSDLFLGGEEFDNAIADYLLSEADFSEMTKSLVKKDKLMFQKLCYFAECSKVELSSAFETVVKVSLLDGNSINLTLTRSKFENLVNHLIEKMKNQIQSCLKEAEVTVIDVDEVLLVGGMSRVPKVQRAVCEIFEKSPRRGGTNPEEAVVLGAVAAIQAGHFGKNPWND